MMPHPQRGTNKDLIVAGDGNPERALVAEIIRRAIDDIRTGTRDEAIIAYEWFRDRDRDLCRYCWLLDLDPVAVCAAVMEKYRRHYHQLWAQRQAARKRKELSHA